MVAYKGNTFYGFKLLSLKQSVIFYAPTVEGKNKWSDAIISLNKCANINSFYEMNGIIGKGKFGVVRNAIHKETKTRVAVKGLVKSKMKPEDLEMIKREIEILRICKHPNIVKLFDYFENEHYMFIVIEYLAGGDLINYFEKRKYFLKESHCALLIIQMLQGVEYLHSNNIIHRDLKGENILMSSDDNSATLKISDFGVSKIIGPDEKCKEPYGTLGYAAPEIYLQKPYGTAVDIWGVGVVAYTLLSQGNMPFNGDKDSEIV